MKPPPQQEICLVTKRASEVSFTEDFRAEDFAIDLLKLRDLSLPPVPKSPAPA